MRGVFIATEVLMTTNLMRGRLPFVRWSAVFAGVAMALAVHVCLGLLGAAIGYSAEARDSRALGVLAGLWALMSASTASLLGAVVACRIAAAADNRTAWLHGGLVWSLGLVIGAVFLSGTLAASVTSVSYAWNGGIVADAPARDAGPGEAFDSAAGSAATASLLGAAASLFGLMGALVGASIGRESVALDVLPVREEKARTYASSLMPPPTGERRDESDETLWSDPAFDRRRSVHADRRRH
jgi:hypothetical protein